MAIDPRFNLFLPKAPIASTWHSTLPPSNPVSNQSTDVTRLALASMHTAPYVAASTAPMAVESEPPAQRAASIPSTVSIPSGLLWGLSRLLTETKAVWSEFNDGLYKLDLMTSSASFLDSCPLIEYLSDLQKASDPKSKGEIALKISELLNKKKEGILNIELSRKWKELGIKLIQITDRSFRVPAASFPDEDFKEQDLDMEAVKPTINEQLEISFQIGNTYLEESLNANSPIEREKSKGLALKWFEKTRSAAAKLNNKEMQGKALFNMMRCCSSKNYTEFLMKAIGYIFAASYLGYNQAKTNLNQMEDILYRNLPLKRALVDWYSDKEYPLIPTQPIREWISSLYH